MKSSTIPKGPWDNPNIDIGDHDVKIVEIRRGCYGLSNDMYLQVVFWLKGVERHLVTNLYFPKGNPDAKTVKRLSGLCQIVGQVPQDALDSPREFKGAELRIRVRKFTVGGREDALQYSDVERFLPLEA